MKQHSQLWVTCDPAMPKMWNLYYYIKCCYAIFWHDLLICLLKYLYSMHRNNTFVFVNSLFHCSFFSPSFQGYEGSLIKLTSKQVCVKTHWALCFYTKKLMNEAINQSVVILLHVCNFLLINTFIFFVPLFPISPPFWVISLLTMKD